jgi:RhtB (resistance to homoserine/threonine) family protein
MLGGFFTIGVLQLLAVISPGPDFAIIVKNTLAYSRRIGIVTTIGITAGVMFHLSYCLLGLAIIISQSIMLFTFVKYLGAGYLIFVGLKSLIVKTSSNCTPIAHSQSALSAGKAFRQGLLCNLLNPKATLFFLGLFTLVVNPHTSLTIQFGYALEIIIITFTWFTLLAMLLTQPAVQRRLSGFQNIINKVIGALLIVFGSELAFFQRH